MCPGPPAPSDRWLSRRHRGRQLAVLGVLLVGLWLPNASVAYATVRAVDVHSDAIYIPPRFLAVFVLLFTLVLGVGWEVLEFDARTLGEAYGPLRYQYGRADTVVELVFDGLGAVVVAPFASDALTELADDYVGRLRDAAE